MQSPPVLKARLLHAEAGSRVVQVSAWRGSQCLGSSLGEATTAEEAEERARQRLLRQLGSAAVQPAAPAQPEPAPEPAAAPPAAATPAPTPASATAEEPASAPGRASLIRHAPGPATAAPAAAATAQPVDAPPPAAAAPQEPQADPEDWSEELAELDVQLQRLGWDRSQEGLYLERCFGHPSRSRITSYADLISYLRGLRALPAGSDPQHAAVPLRRGELLQQSDQLLQALRWDAAQGRGLLEQHFQRSSRQQLNDEQLLHFNMLLEGELIQAGSEQPAAAAPG